MYGWLYTESNTTQRLNMKIDIVMKQIMCLHTETQEAVGLKRIEGTLYLGLISAFHLDSWTASGKEQ